MTFLADRSVASTGNNSTTPLNDGQTFTGTAELNNFHCLLVTLKTDADGVLYIDFSPDGTNWDSTLTTYVDAGAHEIHRAVKAARYVRVRLTNNSGGNQSYLRLYTYFGNFSALNSPLNSEIREDADASIVRTIDPEIDMASGRFQGFSIVNKFGTNSDIDTASVPEDIWENGGVYTGFPATGEPLRAVSTSTDDDVGGTGAEIITAQAMTEDWEWVEITFTLNGTGAVAPDAPYASTNFIRCHTATVTQSANGANTGVNAGTITVYQSVTTTNIFLSMRPGRNQTNCSAYTIPAGYTGYMRFVHCSIRGTAQLTQSQGVEGRIWTRAFGHPFRSRRPFISTSNYRLEDNIYGGLVFAEKSDVVLRITTSSADNISVSGGYDMILSKNLG